MTMTAPLDFSQGSGKALFADYLNQIGLGALAESAWSQWLANPNEGEFLLWLRGTPEYKARFPYAETLRKQNVPFTEAGAIAYENNARQLLAAVGAPKEFVTQDLLNKLIGGNVGFNELEQRVAGGLAEYENAPEAVKQEFRAQLGDDAALIGFFLDPQHTLAEIGRIKAGAQVKGYGKQYGFNGLDFDAAGQYALGMSAEQIKANLAAASQFGALARGTLDQPDTYGGDELVRDVFNQSQQRIQHQLEQRAAEFSNAAGGYQADGRTGFGSARGA